VMGQIRAYAWPGNVRELENTLERSVLFGKGSELTRLELDAKSDPSASTQEWNAYRNQILADAEQVFLNQALQTYRGDINEVAAAMGLTSRAVYGKLKKYGISASDFKKR
jgi:DNA-binding NtrC family response regulator